MFYTPNFLEKVPIVAAASHSNVVYPFVVCPLSTFQVWKGEQLLTNKKSMESHKCHYYCLKSSFLQFYGLNRNEKWFKSHSFQLFLVCLFEIRISTIEIEKKKKIKLEIIKKKKNLINVIFSVGSLLR